MDGETIDWANLPKELQIAIIVVGTLIVALSLISGIISIVLMIKYVKYNRKQNSLGMTGQDLARKILDEEGLENIKVKCTGSFLFGNSYSHFFKKVRLRRLTWKKSSVSSLAMATQKCSLAVLDRDKDPAMKTRIALTPLIYFGPMMFVPLVIIGILIDIMLFNFSGTATMVVSGIGFAFYILSFVMSILVLNTEVKAQKKALELCKEKHYATDEEIEDMKSLFKLYNIEYVNDMVMALLEIIWRILMLLARASNSSSDSSPND